MKKNSVIIGLLCFFSLVTEKNFAECPSKTCRDRSHTSRKKSNNLVTLESLVKESGRRSDAAEILEHEINNTSYELVVLDFYADWCPPCKKLGEELPDIAKELPDVYFIKINKDKFPNLVDSYGVQGIPAIRIIKDGQVIDKIGGNIGKHNFIKKFKSHLSR